ncbi:hypothetical protein NDU88_005594 [Pleurodeles waltl]|uniref:Uncharacterized protein n=1 Tax=Pleurodeles waltl TaxID=8319 RepID=A0AAV7TV77_PLEWA|nr:hypothetical protein NDU88_005594 [Pleurodeles waltl]
MCRMLVASEESAGSLRRGCDGLCGALFWIHAALELRKSRRAALRFPVRGIVGRASTSRAAAKAVAEKLVEGPVATQVATGPSTSHI